MNSIARRFLVAVVAVSVVGCGNSHQPKSPKQDTATTDVASAPVAAPKNSAAEAPSEDVPSENSGTANVSGRVSLKGEMPPPRKLSITKDPEVCGAVDTIKDVEGVEGGVANVVIEIKGVKGDDWKYEDPADGYEIRQKNCQFAPSLVVIPLGKDIHVYNDDPVGHNVNTGAWNLTQPPGPKPIIKPMESKLPVKIVCNIHSWMEGWIYPVKNPYFAVTDTKGEFNIAGVPPGKYRVNIWHPSLGRKTARLTLEAGKSATLDHEYAVK